MDTIKYDANRVTQQSLAEVPEIGEHKADRLCVPVCFFIAAKVSGYLQDGPGSDLPSFAESMDWEKDFVPHKLWMRASLSETVREKYGVSVVSWGVGRNTSTAPQNIEGMRKAGYLGSPREMAFYETHVVGKSVEDLAREGNILIVSMLPKFGSANDKHSVVVTGWTDDSVTVYDPDARNTQHNYPPDHVRNFINPEGACTLILPPDIEAKT